MTPRSLTDNFSTAYQLLEEMLDNGHPIITEPNALQTLIAPPSLAGKLGAFISGGKSSNVSETLGEGAMSIIPWRRAGVKYAANEIYFDIVEEVDAIYEANGTLVSSDVRGTISCKSHMSGTPDLTLIFNSPGVIEDCAFHPCVRYGRWERESVVSFVPPDGPFTLMTYRLNDRAPQTPLVCRPAVSWRGDGTGRAVALYIGGTSNAPFWPCGVSCGACCCRASIADMMAPGCGFVSGAHALDPRSTGSSHVAHRRRLRMATRCQRS